MGGSTVIPHIIGTTAMITLYFLVGTYYNGFYTQLHSEAYKAQLGQVADYIATNIIDLVTLCQLTEHDLFLVKDVEVHTFIGEKIYNISLITMTPSYGDMEIKRVVAQIDALNIYATSDLPWSMNATVEIYTNQPIVNPHEGTLNLTSRVLSTSAVGRAAKIDGFASMVVWCSKTDGSIIIGLGVMDRIQGG